MLLAYSAHRRWGYTFLHCYLEKLLLAEQAGQDPYDQMWISSQFLFYKHGVKGTLNEVRTLAACTGRLVMLGLRQEARHLTALWLPRLSLLCCSDFKCKLQL